MPDSSYYHQTILDNCRWMFGQEVRIITYKTLDDNHTIYHGLVVPKAYSLRSLSHCEVNGKILLQVQKRIQTGSAMKDYTYYLVDGIYFLFEEIERRMSEIFKFDSGANSYSIDQSQLPAELPGEEVTPTEITEAHIIPRVPIGTQQAVNHSDSNTDGWSAAKVEKLMENISQIQQAVQGQQHSINNPPPLTEDSTQLSSAPARGSEELYQSVETLNSANEDPSKAEVGHPSQIHEKLTTETPETDPSKTDVAHPSQINQRLTTETTENVPYETETSASAASMTPGPSSVGTITPVAAYERENVLGLNRQIIREEINAAIRGIFSSFAEHMKGD